MGPIVLYLNYFFLIPDEVNVHATVYISNTATCKKKKILITDPFNLIFLLCEAFHQCD